MEWNVLFFLNSALLGVGLAMDAFSVSLANGLNEPHMKKNKSCGIAGVFAFFQALMPMTGWICVHTIVEYFHAFEKFIPWIALILLAFIGGKMVVEGIRSRGEDVEKTKLGFGTLMVQGIATSIDALAVGVTFSMMLDVNIFLSILLIGSITFLFALAGVKIGNLFGDRFEKQAGILGGCILLAIGVKILLEGLGILG